MVQLRKMLGDISSEECVALMHLIETQSKSTLSKWAIEYARRNYLTVYQRHCADDHTMAGLLAVCRAYAMGEGELKQAKNAIKMMRQRARELGEQPVAQVAARALSTGCAAIQTPSNAFGFLLYGAAAVSYDELGLACERETYDATAARELRRALASLQSAAIAGEANPAKISWNC